MLQFADVTRSLSCGHMYKLALYPGVSGGGGKGTPGLHCSRMRVIIAIATWLNEGRVQINGYVWERGLYCVSKYVPLTHDGHCYEANLPSLSSLFDWATTIKIYVYDVRNIRRCTNVHGRHKILWRLSACANSVNQAFTPPPPETPGYEANLYHGSHTNQRHHQVNISLIHLMHK